ncbi:MAG: hypothetical protein NXH90_15695 [Flavobacteriaceae bacterium]|nr:hypothetical protein [Flavobacteriaceae bacterium]
MNDIELIENTKRSIGLDLPQIIAKAMEVPYIFTNEGQSIGELQLKGAKLYFRPYERFKPHAHIIEDFIGDEDFKEKVKNICSLVVQFRKSKTQGYKRIVSIKEKDYHSLLGSHMLDANIESLKENYDDELHFKIMETKELIRI